MVGYQTLISKGSKQSLLIFEKQKFFLTTPFREAPQSYKRFDFRKD
jgi:hypothetical protein